jgi:hypothetical protein
MAEIVEVLWLNAKKVKTIYDDGRESGTNFPSGSPEAERVQHWINQGNTITPLPPPPADPEVVEKALGRYSKSIIKVSERLTSVRKELISYD